VQLELSRQTDRGLAIVGGAIVQGALKELILRTFTRVTGTIKNMFEPDGALAAFASQIRLAYALGLIDHATYNDLELVRKIRNKAAHYVHWSDKDSEPEELVTFQNKTIRQWALTLSCPLTFANTSKDPRERFECTCQWLSTRLQYPLTDGDNRPIFPIYLDGIPF
jgi:hypothetical protein